MHVCVCVQHVMGNPNTLLPRFFGMHRVKPHKKRQVHFLIFSSVFCKSKYIHVTFDLKVRSGRVVSCDTPHPHVRTHM